MTRTVSWTVGDPKRKQDKWIEIESARKPEKAKLRASYNFEGAKRQGENLYTSEIEPEGTGFHSAAGSTYSYNYNSELEEIGYSDRMKEIARTTGGQVYSPGEKDRIEEEVKQFGEREVTVKKTISVHLLAVALILLLAEIGYRKMNGKK